MDDSTTKQCRKCGEPKPLNFFTLDNRYVDGRYPWCADCRRAWRQGRKERQRELERQWAAQNRDRVRKLANQSYARNKEKITPRRRAYDRMRWHTDPVYRAKKNQWKTEQFKINPVFREKRRLWGRLTQQRRRARARALVNTLTRQEWQEILKEQGHTCAACGRRFNFQCRPCMDHIAPLSQGHGLTKENCQALCKLCNSRKHTKTIDYRKAIPKQTSFLDGDG